MQTVTAKEHWILRITPQRYRECVIRIGIFFGAFCSLVVMMGAFLSLLIGPFAFAVWRPTAPISQPILWLRRISGEAFVLTYTLVMMAVVLVVFTGHTFGQYLLNKRSCSQVTTDEN